MFVDSSHAVQQGLLNSPSVYQKVNRSGTDLKCFEPGMTSPNEKKNGALVSFSTGAYSSVLKWIFMDIYSNLTQRVNYRSELRT